MRYSFPVLVVVLAVGITGCASRHLSPEAVSRATWQQSESISVELGVRDKNNELGSFMSLFTVTDPDGSEHSARARVRNGDFSYVTFPSDFDTYEKEGRYSWKCMVASNAVAEGAFEYHLVFGDRRVRIIEP